MRSPNWDERGGRGVSVLVLHYTGMANTEESIARLCDARSKVSAHYLVDEGGGVHKLVDENKRAWHAGKGSWRGEGDVNGCSVGVELQNGGHDFGLPEFGEEQMEATATLCGEIIERWGVEARNVVGHSDVSPGRKKDPGERFDWEWLALRGVGAWARAAEAMEEKLWGGALGLWGYGLEECEGGLEECTRAFQRHFRRGRVDGEADEETRGILAGLLSRY